MMSCLAFAPLPEAVLFHSLVRPRSATTYDQEEIPYQEVKRAAALQKIWKFVIPILTKIQLIKALVYGLQQSTAAKTGHRKN